MKLKRAIISAVVAASAAAIFIYPDEIKSGVIEGLALCAEVIIPSMFIFAVLANFAAESGAARLIALPVSYLFSPLFKIPKNAVYAVIMSFISGYPVGAAGVARLYKNGEIDRSTAVRMLSFCVNASPPTVIVAIGGLLGSYKIGWIMYGSHILASILIGAVTAVFIKMPEIKKTVPTKQKSPAECFVNATAEACSQMMAISGFVVFFCAVMSVIGDKSPYLTAVLEVTSGAKLLAASGASVPIIAGLIGFGGIAVICQVMSIAKGIASLTELLFERVANGVLTTAICTACLKLFGESIDAMSNIAGNSVRLSIVAAPATAAMLAMAATFLAALRQKN